MWCNIDWSADVETSLHFYNKFHSWCIILLMSYWIWFANIVLRIFASVFIAVICLLFSVLVVSGFGIRVIVLGFPGGNPPANAGNVRDAGSVPGSGRSHAGGHSSPLRYSCLENPMEVGSWQATVSQSWTRFAVHNAGLIKWVWKCSFILCVLEDFEKDWY